MGAEDHKRIKGASDKDCGHLEWVQDRIIWLNARRYWIELELSHAAFTVEAMFSIQEIFGGSSELIEAIWDEGRNGFSVVCKVAEILSQQGELVRQDIGYDPQPITDAEIIAATMAPSEITVLKIAVPATLSYGMIRKMNKNGGAAKPLRRWNYQIRLR